MPYTWMGHENAAAASVVAVAIPKILAWYERRNEKDKDKEKK